MYKRFLGILTVLFMAVVVTACSNAQTQGILRLHVIANSNSAYDQSVKLKVKDEVSAIMAKRGITSYAEAMDIVLNDKDVVMSVVNSVLEREGAPYQATMEVGNYHFPEKTYGKAVFKEGHYNAVRIRLGESKGENWWCVMFPPICFVDSGSEWDLNAEDNVEFKSLLSAFIK